MLGQTIDIIDYAWPNNRYNRYTKNKPILSLTHNILYNFSNYCIDDVQDYLKEVPIGDLFPETYISYDEIFTKVRSESERKEESTTLKMMWDSGDLSFAPDPNSYDYIHRSKDNINLSLSVINQMTVRTDCC